MLHKTRITCILTSHGRVKELKTMYDCLQNQTYPPHEIIPLCSGYGSELLPIHAYEVPDENDWGHSKRALGITKAVGSYILFANDDDWYDPTFLEKMVEKISDTKADIVYCNFKSHLYGGAMVDAAPEHGRITSGNFIVRRKLARQIGWKHRHYQADWEFINECIQAGATFAKVKECLYVHN